ncbi:VLRF1 family aeRF1-type release factor [Natribacillus halophilus]|uniref:Protein required for attachment to host cells n=1 Tax=Natribacillus halophilus TaxID=549003 RepID=A0A1G8NWA3_9BACI|nr:VLRF1 family aeRF1-type release factor [Natribacillus halophilus]SDI83770.1 hypothetical protein SAMN04488123_10735 [Natribacillus halophilus]
MVTMAKELKRIKEKEDDIGILTIYLNTDISDQSQTRGEWQIRLKNGMNDLEDYAKKSESQEEKNALKNLLDKAETKIYDKQKDMQKSFVLMASADGQLWKVKILQAPVETSFHWERQAETGQLEQLLHEYPETGIIVTQQRDVTFIQAALGEIREEKKFHWDLKKEDWVDYQDPSPPSATDTSEDHFQRRFEENKHRWYKSLASILTKEIKNRNLNGVYLVGSKVSTRDLGQHLDETHVIGTVPKNLGSKPSHEILNEVYNDQIR